MTTNKDIKFPYYSGNIFYSKVIGHVTLEQFIHAHKNPKPNTLKVLSKVRYYSEIKDEENKKLQKHKLQAFTPGVYVEIGQKRRYVNVKYFTGLMQLDFDKIPDAEVARNLKQHLFDMYPEIVCAYISPSGLGVKALMKIQIDTNKQLSEKEGDVEKELDMYRAFHKAITTEFEQYGYFDEVTKNAILPLFLGHDPDILYRKYEDCPFWIEQDWSVEVPVNLNNTITPSRGIGEDIYNYQRVVRIITTRINNIIDNGHPQVRNTALVLGSRVGAGYLTQSEAEQLMENLIKSNSYLGKGIKGYIRTSNWGIKNGLTQPKYF